LEIQGGVPPYLNLQHCFSGFLGLLGWQDLEEKGCLRIGNDIWKFTPTCKRVRGAKIDLIGISGKLSIMNYSLIIPPFIKRGDYFLKAICQAT